MPTFAELVDDFEDGSLDTGLWSGSYGDPDEVGGRARIPCTTGYAGLKSGSVYTLTASGITIRLHPPTPNGAASAAASCLVLTSTGGTDAGFIVDSAQTAVGLYLREGYADGGAVFLTYNDTDHAWLRFREDAGTLHWDTSPDGVDWTNRRTAATPTWAADTNLAFLIEGHRDAGTNDFIEVDSVNAPLFNTITGSADLAAEGTLAVTGVLRARGGTALLGETTLAAAGTRRATGTATATANSALAAAGARTIRGTATLVANATATIADSAIDYGFTTGPPTLPWEVGTPWL
ncbi:hypothetical protein PV755_09515 [Streptomyces caniscabiei]|uniref:Uncharacterized protein n=1 Tax=Streptomyces caniscabiei TaxID=2746961 RepID=A0A927KYW7_9ACTN|nr:hypothetical protein [Streptomyces caniscabiei]MBD9721968.1 hypothetical protein [Streptomyces caniscabiei]MDX3509160.1 hypothetical protein [Streptomyces caniscabiei]MDX3717087.1 hypothetical protein [Streptomyces caniscabiei]WEO22955.1 hypothetical protein IHE65_07210 [Streptomyces caniscabiei]